MKQVPRRHTKFVCHGNLVPGICAPLLYFSLLYFNFFLCIDTMFFTLCNSSSVVSSRFLWHNQKYLILA